MFWKWFTNEKEKSFTQGWYTYSEYCGVKLRCTFATALYFCIRSALGARDW